MSDINLVRSSLKPEKRSVEDQLMLIDLTLGLTENTPVYPGDPATKIQPAGSFENDGFCTHYISINSHVGTHIDAPMHMFPGGKSLNELQIDNFVGSAHCLDVSNGDFSAVAEVDISEGDIILFHTGLDIYEPAYFSEFPVMSEAVAHYLVNAKVKMVGIDACSVDNKEDFPNHKILLTADIPIIENLTNLDQLLGHEFRIYALPLKLELDAAPARVIAEISKQLI